MRRPRLVGSARAPMMTLGASGARVQFCPVLVQFRLHLHFSLSFGSMRQQCTLHQHLSVTVSRRRQLVTIHQHLRCPGSTRRRQRPPSQCVCARCARSVCRSGTDRCEHRSIFRSPASVVVYVSPALACDAAPALVVKYLALAPSVGASATAVDSREMILVTP